MTNYDQLKSILMEKTDVMSTQASVYLHYLHLSCYYLQFEIDWKGKAVGPAVKTINYSLLLEDVFCNVHTNVIS